jgi:sigma-B regulation protein RsbU (phosphoserine phosphatase)
MTAEIIKPRAGEVKFLKNYTLIMISAYLTIFVGLSIFFIFSLREEYKNEIRKIETEVDRHGQTIEYLLRSSIDQLENLRMAAELETITDNPCNPLATATGQQIQQTKNGFDLDRIADKDSGGNLIGIGSLQGRNKEFYCDLQTALSMRKGMRSLAFTLPIAYSVSFISVHDFYLLSPWQSSATRPSVEAVMDSPLWSQGKQHALIDRRQLWSPVFFSGVGTGLVAPISAAVYDDKRLTGILSVELSLDFINRINKNFGYPAGATFIYDEKGAVIAHPRLFADPLEVRQVPTLAQALSPDIIASVDVLKQLPFGVINVVNGEIIFQYELKSAPWDLVFTIPQSTLINSILLEFGPVFLGVLAILALLMMSSYLVTTRQFVKPAAKLVEHVSAESNFNPRPIPQVPKQWRPWFEAITRAFRESLKVNNLQREIDIASQLQSSILPRHWPQDDRYEIRGSMTPAKYVGGDFYDHFLLNNEERAIVVADVSGKGVSAGLFSMVSKTYLRSIAMYGSLEVNDLLFKVNNRLCEDNDTCMFVTAFYGQYNAENGHLVMSNAGHPPQLLITADSKTRWIIPEKSNPALGIVEDVTFVQSTLILSPGDQLLIFSDGVNEAMSTMNEEFGFDKITALFENNPSASARESVERTLEAIRAHAKDAEQSDDITCIALHRLS